MEGAPPLEGCVEQLQSSESDMESESDDGETMRVDIQLKDCDNDVLDEAKTVVDRSIVFERAGGLLRARNVPYNQVAAVRLLIEGFQVPEKHNKVSPHSQDAKI